jgi:hypothetical protein
MPKPTGGKLAKFGLIVDAVDNAADVVDKVVDVLDKANPVIDNTVNVLEYQDRSKGYHKSITW